MDRVIPTKPRREPWNKGKLVGQKAPLAGSVISGRTRRGCASCAQSNRSTRFGLSALARGCANAASLQLPGAHAIRHALVEVARAHGSFDTPEPHSLSHLIAHASEGNRDALALQLLDGVQQRVEGGGVDQVHRSGIE